MTDDVRQLLVSQLPEYYRRVALDREHSAKIRTWCITVWLAVLIRPFGADIGGSSANTILPYAPIILFWLLDGFVNAFIRLTESRASKLEHLLAGGEYTGIRQALFLVSGHSSLSLGQKLKAMIHSLLFAETVTIFYLLLVLATVIVQTLQ